MLDHHVHDRTRITPGDAVAAVILVEQSKYVLQLRDDAAGVFFPGHWGLFGGGVEAGETLEEALRRELDEELGVSVAHMRPLFGFEFDLTPLGLSRIHRTYFEVNLSSEELRAASLCEGQRIGVFTRDEVLRLTPTAPYDGFALWLVTNASRLDA